MDLLSHSSEADVTPRQHKIFEINGYDTETTLITAQESNMSGGSFTLFKPIGLSLPNHEDFHSLLTSFSSRLANRYLVTGVIQCTSENSEQSIQPITSESYLGCEYILLLLYLYSISDC